MPQPPAFGAPWPPPGGGAQPTSGSPYQPPEPEPFSAPPAPGAAYPPVSGTPYPPVSGAAYPPVSGTPYPPAPGAPVPPYLPGGPGYPPPGRSSGGAKPVIITLAIVAVLGLLCCVGGIVVLGVGANEAAKEVEEPRPWLTNAPDRPGVVDPESPASPSPGRTPSLKLTETLVVSDEEGTMEITVHSFRTSATGCRSYSPAPKKGLYLMADVTAKVTKGNVSINPLYFRWVADDGTSQNGLSGVFADCGKMLDSGVDLPAGTERKGTVTFDVADKDGVMEYQHNFRTAGRWKP
jgi:hypothetical protein